jgi:hypothetical protein
VAVRGAVATRGEEEEEEEEEDVATPDAAASTGGGVAVSCARAGDGGGECLHESRVASASQTSRDATAAGYVVPAGGASGAEASGGGGSGDERRDADDGPDVDGLVRDDYPDFNKTVHLGRTCDAVQASPRGLSPRYLEIEDDFGAINLGGGNGQLDLESGELSGSPTDPKLSSADPTPALRPLAHAAASAHAPRPAEPVTPKCATRSASLTIGREAVR